MVEMTVSRQLAIQLLSVGVVNTILGWATIFLCMALGLHPVLSNVIGYCIGLVGSFFLKRSWVFSSNGELFRQIGRFLISFCAAFLLNISFLVFLIWVGVNPLVAQLFSWVVYFLVMTQLSVRWTFRGEG